MSICECLFWHLQSQLVSMWQDISQSELSLNQQLSEFYDTLLSSWHSQLQWSSQVRRTTLHYKDRITAVLTHCMEWLNSDEKCYIES